MYAQNAILVNEFTGHSWSRVSECIHLYFHGMSGREEQIVLDSVNEEKKNLKILINILSSPFWYCITIKKNMHCEFSSPFPH